MGFNFSSNAKFGLLYKQLTRLILHASVAPAWGNRDAPPPHRFLIYPKECKLYSFIGVGRGVFSTWNCFNHCLSQIVLKLPKFLARSARFQPYLNDVLILITPKIYPEACKLYSLIEVGRGVCSSKPWNCFHDHVLYTKNGSQTTKIFARSARF